MVKGKKTLIKLSIILGITAGAIATSAYAWFKGGRDSIAAIDQLDGALLQGYFHSGDGSENDPFTITTPWHYENFAKLHYDMDGFAEKGYHFEFGYPLNGGTTRYFYGTDENGVVDFTNTRATTLNLGGDSFDPIGNEELPFIGSLNGNNLTISNFEVDGNGYHDVGIFGFIGETSDGIGGKIDNAYFSDFTINTQGATEVDAHDNVGTRIHNEYAHVGYIAGHVVRATDINNVYVNNCTIDGKTTKDRTVDTYGYYGKVEYDHTGGQRQAGDNYSFTLNAKEVHDYFSDNYSNIRDLPLRSRVGVDQDDAGRHYADYDFPVPGEPEWANDRAAHPFSDAVSVNGTGTTYTLNGTTTDEYEDRTYSLSTLGYQELKTGEKREYHLQYKNSSGQLVELPEDLLVDEYTPSLDNQYEAGDYMRYENGSDPKWIYQHSDNDGTTDVDAKNIAMTYSFPTDKVVDLPGQVGLLADFSVRNVRCYFSVDGVWQMNGSNNYFDGSCTVRKTSSSTGTSRAGGRVQNLKINNLPSTLSLKRGVHYFSFTIIIYTDREFGRYISFYLNGSTVNFTNQSDRVNIATCAAVNVTQEIYNSQKLTLTATQERANRNTTDPGNADVRLNDTRAHSVVPPYNPGTSFEADVYATDLNTGTTNLFTENSGDLDIHERTHKEAVPNAYKEVYMKNGAIYEGYDFETHQVNTPVTPDENTIYSVTNVDNPDAITTGIFYYYGSTFKDDIINVYEGNRSLFYDSQLTDEVYPDIGQVYYATNTGSYFKYDVNADEWHNMSVIDKFDYWVAENQPARDVDYDKDPVYIANELEDVNYKFKNIDIVGGNVSFTYIGYLGFIPVNLQIISLPPETQNTNIVEYPTTAQIDGRQQFYATQSCPGSIVMYVNNSANALDNIDSQIGHIEFTYANMNYRGISLINLEVPSFKKGSGNFVDIRTMGRIEEGEQAVNFVSTFTGDITETGAKKCSYACLDQNGKMLGVYDTNGNPGYGFFKAATDEPADQRYSYTPGTGGFANGRYTKSTSGTYVIDEEKVRSIATYVVVLGANSRSSNNNTYITEIVFDYKAHEGSGGSFGPVGYRDRTDTVTDTILNFYLDAKADLNYSIKVYFNKNDSIYYITFSASDQVTINIFNYEIDNYSIYFNGKLLADDAGHNMQVNVVNYDPGG